MNTDLVTAAISAALASDWHRASQLNVEILKDDPENIDALNRLGRSYLELGEIKKSVLYFRRVLKLDRYNQIAKKNLLKIDQYDKRKKNPADMAQTIKSYCDFIEEPGKTKIVNLVNMATPRILSVLTASCAVKLKPKRHTVVVCLSDLAETYIGSLPDDLGHRLAILIKTGNSYEAFVKSASQTAVSLFLRELSRGRRYRNVASFPTVPDRLLPHPDDVISSEGETKPSHGTDADTSDEDDENSTRVFKNLHQDEEPEV